LRLDKAFDSRVNYLSHSVLAAEASDDPLFALGSMLPDLANMARHRLPSLLHPALAAGVAFHERTDSVFHQCPSFVELNHEASKRLLELGVSRGPARATAHIGTEMLIDATFAENEGALRGYLAALHAGSSNESVWAPLDPVTAREFRRLLEHLERGGSAIHHASKSRFVTRLAHALAGRPRLEPTSEELTVLAEFCEAYLSAVRGKMPRLLYELRSRLFSNSNETSPRS